VTLKKESGSKGTVSTPKWMREFLQIKF